MSEIDPRGMEVVPMTEQDKADLLEAHECIAGDGMPNPAVSAFEQVTTRVLVAHGFDPTSCRFDPSGPVLWGRRATG
jgi:hypothetical protein